MEIFEIVCGVDATVVAVVVGVDGAVVAVTAATISSLARAAAVTVLVTVAVVIGDDGNETMC